ncbi:MAG: hypothetical protein HYY23_07525 [Verrucomicrobia bacterium]|nr:hypothetical protein [Verrucomicrobiota bacterium]
MKKKEFQIILVSTVVITGVVASLVIQVRARVKHRENDAVLRLQQKQLAEWAVEHRRLSNRVTLAVSSPAEDRATELAMLRAEAVVLRQQTNELGTQAAENHQSQSQISLLTGPGTHFLVGGVSVVSVSNSEEYARRLDQMASRNRKLADARNLSRAVRWYAPAHEGEFPPSFDQAAPYFYPDQPTPQTDGFEIVFQGSRQELTGVPEGAVVLIRERQPWRTPVGKWARIYVMANGQINVVEADDNFRSWEEEHIIPPPLSEPRSDH